MKSEHFNEEDVSNVNEVINRFTKFFSNQLFNIMKCEVHTFRSIVGCRSNNKEKS